jgi:hypothetical protein
MRKLRNSSVFSREGLVQREIDKKRGKNLAFYKEDPISFHVLEMSLYHLVLKPIIKAMVNQRYTVKKLIPDPSRDVTYQTLPGRE